MFYAISLGAVGIIQRVTEAVNKTHQTYYSLCP